MEQMGEEEVNSYYSCNREEMAKYIPKNAKRILDVGCGAGNFGALLKSRMSVEVWGIEKIVGPARGAKTKLDRVIVGDIENDSIELPLDYYDCVAFNDALEHFVDPWSVLKRIKTNIVNKGTVVASIPNVRYWDNIKSLLLYKQWDYEEHGILDRTHVRFFTVKSIQKMFVECGYEPILIEGINGSQFSWKFRLVNSVLNHSLDDVQFRQFACVARNL